MRNDGNLSDIPQTLSSNTDEKNVPSIRDRCPDQGRAAGSHDIIGGLGDRLGPIRDNNIEVSSNTQGKDIDINTILSRAWAGIGIGNALKGGPGVSDQLAGRH